MAAFLGNLAGMLMIALIAVLLYQFLIEMGVNVSEDGRKKIKKYALAALGFIFVQILAMGIIYNFNADDENITNIFNLRAIWNVQAVRDYQGTPSVYILLRDLFAKVLFGRTDDCAIYISFLSAVVTAVASGFYLDSLYDEDTAERLHILFWCIPGSFMIFLPSPFSMMLAFYSLYLVMAKKGKKGLAGLFAVLALMTHIAGIIALILYILDMFPGLETNKNILYIRALTAASCGIILYFICKQAGLAEGTEFIMAAALPAAACLGRSEAFIKSDAYKYSLAVLTILCGTFAIKIM